MKKYSIIEGLDKRLVDLLGDDIGEIASVCRIENEVDCNGRSAYLPHTLFQSTLFSATRERSENERQKDYTVVVRKENE